MIPKIPREMQRYLYSVFVVISCLRIAPASDSTPNDPPQVPCISITTLKEIVGPDVKIWNWRWKEISKANYTPEIKALVESDVKLMVVAGQLNSLRFSSPMILYAILQNPTRPLIYFVLLPDTSEAKEGSLDENLVYAYDTKSKSLVFKA